MQDEKKEHVADLIADADAALEDHAEECAGLRERFDDLKPEIQEVVGRGPEVGETEDALTALQARRDAFESLAAEVERMEEHVADLSQELSGLMEDLTGPDGALRPLQDLDQFAGDEDLLQDAREVLERYQVVRWTRFNPFAETLDETRSVLAETHEAYLEEAASIDEEMESPRAQSTEP
jgi:DNA repair exonuclease SbcCD ATPase subunit